MGAVDPERKADSTATLPPGYALLSHAAPRVRAPVPRCPQGTHTCFSLALAAQSHLILGQHIFLSQNLDFLRSQ